MVPPFCQTAQHNGYTQAIFWPCLGEGAKIGLKGQFFLKNFTPKKNRPFISQNQAAKPQAQQG